MDILSQSMLMYYASDLPSPSASSYVEDGLVLWLDGINNTRSGHDASASGWEDLSGSGFDFVPYSTGKMPTINSDHYTGFAEDTFLKCTDSSLVDMSSASIAGTLEAVIHYPDGGVTQGMVFGFKNINNNSLFAKLMVVADGALVLSGRSNSGTPAQYRTSESIAAHKDNVVSISVTYGASLADAAAQYDGIAMTTTSQNTGWSNNGGGVYVGARVKNNSSDHYPYPSGIYCIRYYNRALTAAEQANNRAVDIARFGAYA